MEPQNRRIFNEIDSAVRSIDPIESTEPNFDDLQLVADSMLDIQELRRIRTEDRDVTGENPHYPPEQVAEEKTDLLYKEANLRLDVLYADNGGGKLDLVKFNDQIKKTFGFFEYAKQESDPTDKQAQWELSVKQLDLEALSVYRNAKEARTTLKGTTESHQAYALAEQQMQGLLGSRTLRLMHDMNKHANGDSREAQKARGMLFETLIVGYARLQTLSGETFDKIFVRTALEREDNHKYPSGQWPKDGYPRRTFDVVVHNDDKPEDELYQLKNNQADDKVYADPIIKVQGDKFHLTMQNLPSLTADFAVMVRSLNDPSITAERVNLAGRRLDDAFKHLIDLS